MNKEFTSDVSESRNERHIVHIINPVSGSGKRFRAVRQNIIDLGEDIYLTKREGDCEDFVAELLTKDPFAHVVSHGGDGTMGETVGGIMKAEAGATALFTGVPSGSGNDFLHYMYSRKKTYGKIYPTDAVLVNGKYSVNVFNVGFDCAVVAEAERIRKLPGMSGGISYIAGIASALAKKESFKTTVTLAGIYGREDEHGYIEKINDEFLLAAVANGQYYGGGFQVAPLADTGDGYIDFLAVRNISIPVFASLVAQFKKGAHLDPETGKVKDKFKKYIYFRKCKKVSFDGIKKMCYDGEIIDGETVDARIVPSAVLYTPPKKAWIV